jgi:hypothetical protein
MATSEGTELGIHTDTADLPSHEVMANPKSPRLKLALRPNGSPIRNLESESHRASSLMVFLT